MRAHLSVPRYFVRNDLGYFVMDRSPGPDKNSLSTSVSLSACAGLCAKSVYDPHSNVLFFSPSMARVRGWDGHLLTDSGFDLSFKNVNIQ